MRGADVGIFCLSVDGSEAIEQNSGAVSDMNAISIPLGAFTLTHIYVSIGICVVFVKARPRTHPSHAHARAATQRFTRVEPSPSHYRAIAH